MFNSRSHKGSKKNLKTKRMAVKFDMPSANLIHKKL